jgi:diacylglycerol kinase family enzyme
MLHCPAEHTVKQLTTRNTRNPVQWARMFGRLALGHPEQSPFAKVTRGKKFRVQFDQKIPFELDGGARPATKKLRIKVHPNSVTICVPPAARFNDPSIRPQRH